MSSPPHRRAFLGLVGLAALAGCSAAPSEATSRPPAVASTAPGGGQLLREHGITNGPANFALPEGLRVLRTIDQPNVVTVVIEPSDAKRTLDYLMLHAAALGLSDIETGNGSMVFRIDGWDGGFTTSSQIAGLTLRRRQ